MKFNIKDHIPPKEEELVCERCDTPGARDFVGEILCDYCIVKDVFDEEADNN